MTTAIVDYGAGNLRSAAKAFAAAAAAEGLDAAVDVTADPERVARADRIVLPGDGAFPDCRRGLAAVSGMDEALDEAVRRRGRPFFGICIGMQLLADAGEEYEETAGLGWMAGRVVRLTPADPALKVPHMGWNTLQPRAAHPLLAGLPLGPEGLHAFFLHAYHFVPEHPADVLAVADYGGPATAVVARDNVAGSQFHPEKSQGLGLRLIANFLRWRP
ncbi:MAG TPA: imidazole glycerol phosphate synthase subunit HisH [Hyphomicrobiales bacterium]|nr:imidazole glycerol phosphate synthase subunit HisH [Hyphomicrobiales bacterium]